VSQIKIKQT